MLIREMLSNQKRMHEVEVLTYEDWTKQTTECIDRHLLSDALLGADAKVVAVEGYKQEGLISETSYKALLKIAYDQKSKDLEQELLRHQQRMSSSAAQHGLAARPSASPFSPAMLFAVSDQAAAPSCQQPSASLLYAGRRGAAQLQGGCCQGTEDTAQGMAELGQHTCCRNSAGMALEGFSSTAASVRVHQLYRQ